MERPKDDYTYLEWVTGIRSTVNIFCDLEIMRISHDDSDERPRELIDKLRRHLEQYEKQIPDEMED